MIEPAHFDLEILKLRRVTYGRSFTCHAAQNRCDRRCSIAMVCIDGKRIPFGGACNRYTNMQKRTKVGADALDLVRRRQDIFLNSIRSPASKSPFIAGPQRFGACQYRYQPELSVSLPVPVAGHLFQMPGFRGSGARQNFQTGNRRTRGGVLLPGRIVAWLFSSADLRHPPARLPVHAAFQIPAGCSEKHQCNAVPFCSGRALFPAHNLSKAAPAGRYGA
jgi:hypothetical protein